MEVDVLIPVYRPDGKLTELLKRLKMQNYPIHRVILMNTEEKHFPAELTGIWDRVEVYHLAKEEFDHGGTRDRGVRMSTADLVVCMTQDAMPADETLIEELVKPFDDPEVWAAYARQLPNEDCREVEKYTRDFCTSRSWISSLFFMDFRSCFSSWLDSLSICLRNCR